MSILRTTLTAVALALLGLGFAADARAADPPTHVVPGNLGDPSTGIDAGRGDSYVWLTGDATRRVGKLLVFMPGGGATNLPRDWTEIGSEGGRLGYHTIAFAYQNDVPIANANACGNAEQPPAAMPDCAIRARTEILDGLGESPVINVSRANSIENRLVKLLQHLAAQHPAEGWAQFLDMSGPEPAPRWSELAVSGQSLGAGQAVLIGQLHLVHRVAAFAGWADARHGWPALSATPATRYVALIHQRDAFFGRSCYAYASLGLAAGCPLAGFALPPALPDPANPLLLENQQPPFASRLLVTNLQPSSLVGVADPYHTSTTRDGWIARELDGTPSQKLLNAWRFAFGDGDADGYVDGASRARLAGLRDELAANGPLADPKANGGLTGAVNALARATAAGGWDDVARPDEADGRDVYDGLFLAVRELRKVGTPWADDAVETVVSVAEEITRLALDEAAPSPARDEAVREKAHGDDAADALLAVRHYRKAWALVREVTA
jgi:hypothetical protein